MTIEFGVSYGLHGEMFHMVLSIGRKSGWKESRGHQCLGRSQTMRMDESHRGVTRGQGQNSREHWYLRKRQRKSRQQRNSKE